MCKKLGDAIVKCIDEDVRLAIKAKLRMVSDMMEWVPNFIDGLVGAITGYKA